VVLARLTPLLAAAALLVSAAPALADNYSVTTTAPGGSTCTGASPDWTCPTLEGAVSQANVATSDSEIFLQAPGTYIPSDTLVLDNDITIIGQGARATAIDGAHTRQVVHVNAGATASLINLTVQNGNFGTGGNIGNQGDLTLVFAHVTAGQAVAAGGIYNQDTLSVLYSLVDHNDAIDGTGGGILSEGTGDLTVAESTVAFNTGFGGGGVFVDGTGQHSILQATIARNSGGGIGVGAQSVVEMQASLIAANINGNCSGPTPIDEGDNLDDANTCALDVASGSKINANPGLSADLQNAGGPTDVLTFVATSPAVDMVVPCFSFYDQRAFQRIAAFGSDPCDAGAYEQSASGPAQPTIQSGPSGPTTATSVSFSFSSPGTGDSFVCQLTGPGHSGGYAPCTSPVTYSGLAQGTYVFSVAIADPTGQAPAGSPTTRTFAVGAAAAQTPTPTPTPSPTPAASPTPVPQKSASGTVVSGTVLIKLGGKFVPLDSSKPIPNGAEIDVTKGKIQLTAKLTPGGKPQTAVFFDGIFKLTLGRKTTDLTLSQPLAKCKRGASAAAKKPKTRKLWGNGSGSFRTRGQYSAATVRGTEWLVQDSCAGTLTRVKKGVVSVFDQVKRRTIVLRAGKSYLAKPRR
jgi:hypothetical protein